MNDKELAQEIQKEVRRLHRQFKGDYTAMTYHLVGQLLMIPDLYVRRMKENDGSK